LYENADTAYYVIGGQGTAKIGGRETPIDTNGFISVPRGTVHSFTRRGNRPLILLAVLSGEPCEQAK
jgi:mannose-6-phosphate isomerase-like protein (cupin superfamily)